MTNGSFSLVFLAAGLPPPKNRDSGVDDPLVITKTIYDLSPSLSSTFPVRIPSPKIQSFLQLTAY